MYFDLTNRDDLLELDFVSNYIIYSAQLIASNINSIYKYYQNNYSFSFEEIVRMSKDEYILSSNNIKLLYDSIKLYLKQKYSIEIISNTKEKIKFRKI